jgi:allantoin racemase
MKMFRPASKRSRLCNDTDFRLIVRPSRHLILWKRLEANISDYMEAFTSPAKKSELQAIFEREARRLIDNGADVIVPTGGIPMMLFGNEPDANVDGAPIVNGVTVVIKAAEMAVKLKRLGVPLTSRIPQSGFALPSAQTLDEFMHHG